MRSSTAARGRGGDDAQADVIAFLADPASYPARPDGVDCFETHGALVFLVGEDAWKIKRAVRFPYMDFSTLEKVRNADIPLLKRLRSEAAAS